MPVLHRESVRQGLAGIVRRTSDRNPNHHHHYFSNKYRETPPFCYCNMPPICIAVLLVPRKGKHCQYSSHLYRCTPPIYIAMRLLNVSHPQIAERHNLRCVSLSCVRVQSFLRKKQAAGVALFEISMAELWCRKRMHHRKQRRKDSLVWGGTQRFSKQQHKTPPCTSQTCAQFCSISCFLRGTTQHCVSFLFFFVFCLVFVSLCVGISCPILPAPSWKFSPPSDHDRRNLGTEKGPNEMDPKPRKILGSWEWGGANHSAPKPPERRRHSGLSQHRRRGGIGKPPGRRCPSK